MDERGQRAAVRAVFQQIFYQRNARQLLEQGLLLPITSLQYKKRDESKNFNIPKANNNNKIPLEGFPGGSAGKEPTCSVGDLGSIPG